VTEVGVSSVVELSSRSLLFGHQFSPSSSPPCTQCHRQTDRQTCAETARVCLTVYSDVSIVCPFILHGARELVSWSLTSLFSTNMARSTQPCIPPGSITKSSTSFGWGKGWNATSAGWQVTLCDPIWHVSSSSGVATSVSELPYPCYFTFTLHQRQKYCTRNNYANFSRCDIRHAGALMQSNGRQSIGLGAFPACHKLH